MTIEFTDAYMHPSGSKSLGLPQRDIKTKKTMP